MAAKKDLNGAMPMTPETDTTPSAKITYANEVVAIIADCRHVQCQRQYTE